jgi:hypothetical protein
MTPRYRRAPSRSTATIPNPRIDRFREARPALRAAGSCVLDAVPYLQGRDLVAATRLIDSADLLLRRFEKLERMAS